MSGLVVNGDLRVNGAVTAEYIGLPANTVRNASVAADAAIEATKIENRHFLHYAQAPGTAIVAATLDLHVVKGGTGQVLSVEGAITGAIATGADREVHIDIQKSTGAAAFATILSDTLDLSIASGPALRTAYDGGVTIDSGDLVDGDILRVVITVAGAAGAQAQGLIVTIGLKEDAE